MIETEIIDNFLDKKDFLDLALQMGILGVNDTHDPFPWYWEDDVAYIPGDPNSRHDNDVIGGQFCHLFTHANAYYSQSPFVPLLYPIYQLLHPAMILRIKANLQPKTPKIELTPWHHDIDIGNKLKEDVTTCILYMNTNNGYTELEDGTKIESIENRFAMFSNTLQHRGTTCTDDKKRVVINFNFILNNV